MYNNFTEEARKILMNAKEEMKELKHPYVGSEHLLLAILKDNNEISDRLKDFDLDFFQSFPPSLKKLMKLYSSFLYTHIAGLVSEKSIPILIISLNSVLENVIVLQK